MWGNGRGLEKQPNHRCKAVARQTAAPPIATAGWGNSSPHLSWDVAQAQRCLPAPHPQHPPKTLEGKRNCPTSQTPEQTPKHPGTQTPPGIGCTPGLGRKPRGSHPSAGREGRGSRACTLRASQRQTDGHAGGRRRPPCYSTFARAEICRLGAGVVVRSSRPCLPAAAAAAGERLMYEHLF